MVEVSRNKEKRQKENVHDSSGFIREAFESLNNEPCTWRHS